MYTSEIMSDPNQQKETFRITRPNVTADQSIVLAQRLFSFRINPTNVSNIKELESYYDRNFLLKGTIQEPCQDDTRHEQYFVMKVFNSYDSKSIYQDFLNVIADLLPFINSKGIQCPVFQTSIFGTKSVLCRIYEQDKSEDVPVNESSTSCMVEEHTSDTEVTKGIKVASKEEENMDDVFAVQLKSFVNGELLCEVNWTKDLLVDYGCKIGRLHKILQEYSKTNSWIATARIKDPEYEWAISNMSKEIRLYIKELKDAERQAHVQNIAKRFQNEVLDQLESRDLQLIHADLNEHNVIAGHSSDGQMEIKGFIDFDETQYSYRLLCLGVALGYLMMEAHNKKFDIIQASGYVLAGYQSEFSLEDSEIDKLLVTAKARMCQSLLLGLHQYQLEPNEYLVYTQKAGWEALESVKLKPESEILESWKKSIVT